MAKVALVALGCVCALLFGVAAGLNRQVRQPVWGDETSYPERVCTAASQYLSYKPESGTQDRSRLVHGCYRVMVPVRQGPYEYIRWWQVDTDIGPRYINVYRVNYPQIPDDLDMNAATYVIPRLDIEAEERRRQAERKGQRRAA